MRNTSNGQKTWPKARCIAPASAIAFVIFAAFPASPEGRDSCAVIEIPRPMTLPSGSTEINGTVRLCMRQILNASTGLHEIEVDGKSYGLFKSRVGKSELISREPLVVFQRHLSGEYHLIGYAWPDSKGMRTYRLYAFGKDAPKDSRNAKLTPLELDNTVNIPAIAAR